MTVMIDKFFAIPPGVIRLGKWKSLSGIAGKLYVALWHESERYGTRELTRTTKQLIELAGGCRNSYNKARAELIKAGLLRIEQYGTEGFIFHLCNPETGKPWPGDPRKKIVYQRKGAPAVLSTQEFAESRRPSKIDTAGTSFPFGWNEDNSPPAEPQDQEPNRQLSWDDIGPTLLSSMRKNCAPPTRRD